MVSRPLYATAVGLTIESEERNKKAYSTQVANPISVKSMSTAEVVHQNQIEVEQPEEQEEQPEVKTQSTEERFRENFLEKYYRKFKEFVEKSE